MLDLLSLITALSLGALGSLHCVMMCGGISCALSSKRAGKQHEKQTGKLSTRLSPLLIYNLGRISSYAMIGFLFGWGSQAVIEQWQSLGYQAVVFKHYILSATTTAGSQRGALCEEP